MNRREMLVRSVGALTVVAVGAVVSQRAHDGLPDELHAETYRQYLQYGEDVEVTLDGTRCSWSCVAANRVEGWADLLVFDTQGRCVIEKDGKVAIERCYGRVAFRRFGPNALSQPLNHAEPQGGRSWRA